MDGLLENKIVKRERDREIGREREREGERERERGREGREREREKEKRVYEKKVSVNNICNNFANGLF